MASPDPASPSLQEQTIELGTTLKAIADSDPLSPPSRLCAQVFAEWLAQAGPTSRKPEFFTDVLDNYDARANTNRDLQDLFTMLQSYIEVPGDDDPPAPAKTFIGLPLLAARPPTPPAE